MSLSSAFSYLAIAFESTKNQNIDSPAPTLLWMKEGEASGFLKQVQ